MVRTVSASLPLKVRNAYLFQATNTISAQICCGSPLVLFALHLQASATTIAILVGLTPILAMAQLPASRYAKDIGYRTLMMRGWSLRVFLILFLLTLSPLDLFLPSSTLVNLLLTIMFFFNLLRGVSTCAWLPWITSIVPESLRGHYLSRDKSSSNVARVVALFLSGTILTQWQGRGAYVLVFFIGFAAGAISLYFLNQIPELVSHVSRFFSQLPHPLCLQAREIFVLN